MPGVTACVLCFAGSMLGRKSTPVGAAETKATLVEVGVAGWYGAPSHNRVASNGEVYDEKAMTAAHPTLPLGSMARITNLKTGRSAIVQITDRSPLVSGRIVDLSLAAAKAVDVYLPGTAPVRLDLLEPLSRLHTGGRWAVQVGPFAGEKGANIVADHLTRRYHSANVAKFAGPTGNWWVWVRVLDDDRHRAESLARENGTEEGSVFVVRLD